MGFNDSLGPLVEVESVTSISSILLVDVDVESFRPINMYQPLVQSTARQVFKFHDLCYPLEVRRCSPSLSSLLYLVNLYLSICFPNSFLPARSHVHVVPWSLCEVFIRLSHACCVRHVCLSIHASPTEAAGSRKSGRACLQAELPVP
jgi:hypothetical protein